MLRGCWRSSIRHSIHALSGNFAASLCAHFRQFYFDALRGQMFAILEMCILYQCNAQTRLEPDSRRIILRGSVRRSFDYRAWRDLIDEVCGILRMQSVDSSSSTSQLLQATQPCENFRSLSGEADACTVDGISNLAFDLAQPMLVPRTTTQNLIFYLLCRLLESFVKSVSIQQKICGWGRMGTV